MKKMAVIAAALLALGCATKRCSAQDDSPPPVTGAPLRSSDDLDQMLGPIALYPDPLIGVILPASAVPAQIVLADRYVTEGGDTNQIAVQPWDPSVQGLAHYPTVLKWMDDNLTWTTELGVAFTSQQTDVMDSIQRLRAKAQSLGNLQTTPQENVVSDDGAIDIDPVDPNEIYVPDYQPDSIYDQPGVYCTFGVGFPIGLWLGYDWDWRHHHLISWGPGHRRPANWWDSSPAVRRQQIAASNPPLWHGARRGSIIVTGGDRGYENRAGSRSVASPHVPAPRETSRASVVGRTPEPSRKVEAPRAVVVGRAPEVSRPAVRSEPSEGAFGGSQSAREVRESSSRGQESRTSAGSGSSRSGGSGRR